MSQGIIILHKYYVPIRTNTSKKDTNKEHTKIKIKHLLINIVIKKEAR